MVADNVHEPELENVPPLVSELKATVPVGVLLALAGTGAYTQIDASTSYWILAGALLLIGAGLGATITPSMAAAFQDLSHAEMPGATSAINVVQRIAGSVGTALLAVVLQRSLAAHSTPADAFGTAFTVAAVLVAVTLLGLVCLVGSAPGGGSALAASRQAGDAAPPRAMPGQQPDGRDAGVRGDARRLVEVRHELVAHPERRAGELEHLLAEAPRQALEVRVREDHESASIAFRFGVHRSMVPE